MIRKIPIHSESLRWIDITAPEPQELQKIASEYGLHPKLVEDCLEPEHLPKFESSPAPPKPDSPDSNDGLDSETTFLLLRSYDPGAHKHADTIQALTRKLAVFFGPGFLITIHRVPLPLIDRVATHWEKNSGVSGPAPILAELLNAVIDSYEQPLEDIENAFDEFERNLFGNHDVVHQLKAVHQIKQRLSIFRRLLWHTQGAIQKLQPASPAETALFQDLRENLEAYYVFSDDMIDSIDALVHTQLAIASHRTNEIVRVLTLFSVFFMPLTFIVGIYGMNFQHMPELKSPWGYPAVLAFMTFICLFIFVWFRKKGFFR